MREIKFRGKINKESDFIYGSLLVIGEETYIYPHDYGDLEDIDFGYAFEKVLPETVGQFTGIHDKNGKEIYEGDIVQDYNSSRRIVQWSITEHTTYGHGEVNSVQSIGFSFDPLFDILGAIIIGSIHENPELINER